MKGKFTVYPVGKSEPTKKGKRSYYFLTGDYDAKTGFFGLGTRGFDAWSSLNYDLQFMKPYEAVLNVEVYGTEVVTRMVELVGVEGGKDFDEGEEVAAKRF
jgi:hypothetical protein